MKAVGRSDVRDALRRIRCTNAVAAPSAFIPEALEMKLDGLPDQPQTSCGFARGDAARQIRNICAETLGPFSMMTM